MKIWTRSLDIEKQHIKVGLYLLSVLKCFFLCDSPIKKCLVDSRVSCRVFKVSSQLLRSNGCLFHPQESITQVEIDHDGQAKNGNGQKVGGNMSMVVISNLLSGTQIHFFGGRRLTFFHFWLRPYVSKWRGKGRCLGCCRTFSVQSSTKSNQQFNSMQLQTSLLFLCTSKN